MLHKITWASSDGFFPHNIPWWPFILYSSFKTEKSSNQIIHHRIINKIKKKPGQHSCEPKLVSAQQMFSFHLQPAGWCQQFFIFSKCFLWNNCTTLRCTAVRCSDLQCLVVQFCSCAHFEHLKVMKKWHHNKPKTNVSTGEWFYCSKTLKLPLYAAHK